MASDTDPSTDMDDRTPRIVAHCATCRDAHPLGDRKMNGITTVCPACGDTRYRSESLGPQTIKPDDERIADAVHNVRGVGEQTQANIIAAFDSYYEFEAASTSDLQAIDGVGRQTAEHIVTKLG